VCVQTNVEQNDAIMLKSDASCDRMSLINGKRLLRSMKWCMVFCVC
jgi:hypothetical protein